MKPGMEDSLDSFGPLSRRGSVALFSNQMSQKKPCLLPSTSFRAATQLPRYSRFSLATTNLASPSVARAPAKPAQASAQQQKKDVFQDEREAALEWVACLVAPKPDPQLETKTEFLKDDFWRKNSSSSNSNAKEAAGPIGEYLETSYSMVDVDNSDDRMHAVPTSMNDPRPQPTLSEGESSSDLEDGPSVPGPETGTLRASGTSADAGYLQKLPELRSSGTVEVNAAPLLTKSLDFGSDTPVQEAKAREVAALNGPSFSLSIEMGNQIIDRFHKVLDLLNASPAPPIKVQLDCHKEMHTLTTNFRHDAIMYGRVIISEVGLPVEHKTIKPLNASGILGGDKYRVGGVYFKFAVDRLRLFGDFEEGPRKVAGHELKSLVQVMECHVPDLRHPLLCIIDYLGFRVIAMSTLPIKGRESLVYGSMDGGKTVVVSPETLDKTKTLASCLNLKEHGLRNQPKEVRISTPADLELHKGSDGHIYALDFSRMFPPDIPSDDFPGGVFYQLLRPEFVRNYPKQLCSDSYTSFIDTQESGAAIREIKEAHAFLMNIVAQFGAGLESERPQTDLLSASEKVVNLMHMKGINCRYLGKVWKHTTSPYWRLVLKVEMACRCLKKRLNKRLRKAVLQRVGRGVSACIAAALTFLNVVFGDSAASSAFWEKKILPDVVSYFFHRYPEDAPGLATTFKDELFAPDQSRLLMGDVRCQMLLLLCQKTGLRLGSLTRETLRTNPKMIRVESPFDDADLHELGVSVTYLPVASFSGAKLKRIMAMETDRRGKAYELNMQASKLYMQALRMNPADPQLLRNCAEVEAALGNYLRADEFFRSAMLVDPSDEGTAFKYAIFCDHSMQLNLAETWYLKALRTLKKNSHRVAVMMTTYADFLLTERRNVDLARRLYELVLAKNPTHVQTAHNLAVLLYDSDIFRAKELFKVALDNAEDDSRVALICRSSASFYFSIREIPTGLFFYQKYKDLKHLISEHPPSLYHATRSIYGPEMDEIREILGPANQFKVRHVFWDEIDDEETEPESESKPKDRLKRSVKRLFDRLQVPCSSEISYICVANKMTAAWEFDALGRDRIKWAETWKGQPAQIGIVLGFQDGNGFQCFEETLEGTIVPCKEAEDFTGWDPFFKVKGFKKTLAELNQHIALLNVRRRAYLRMWTTVSEAFETAEDLDVK